MSVATRALARLSNKRRTQSFEPSGPISEMITLEFNNRKRTNPRARKTDLFEDCIACTLGRKYPKLLERFNLARHINAGDTAGAGIVNAA